MSRALYFEISTVISLLIHCLLLIKTVLRFSHSNLCKVSALFSTLDHQLYPAAPQVLVKPTQPRGFAVSFNEVHRQLARPPLPLHRHLRTLGDAAVWREVQLHLEAEAEVQLRSLLASPAHRLPSECEDLGLDD